MSSKMLGRVGRAALCFALALGAGVTHAQDAVAPKMEVDRASLEKRLAAVATLVESSSAAKQIEASGDARAIEKRNAARSIHKQALQAFQAGDLAKSSQLLPQASVLMFEGVRYAAPEQVTGAKERADFDARMESVKSLLAAQKRIGAEKAAPGSAETTQTLERLIAEANGLAAKDLPKARATLEQAYLIARASIGSMRSGDTLVRTLNFASKEEEYRYEVDRNDTHQMLIQLLLKEKSGTAGVQDVVTKARTLRRDAETAATRGDHNGGIRLLEESTRELVRAIRAAGVYIPG